MPSHKTFRASVSSEHSKHSDESDNSNINDDLPDAGLPKTKPNDAKSQKKISFNFPVDVITKSGKFSGTGTIDLVDTTIVEKTMKLRKTKAELKEVVTQFQQDLQKLMESEQQDELTHIQTVKPLRKGIPPPVDRANKKEAATDAREAKRREVEAKREVMRKAIEHEKRAKAELEQAHRIYKPGECMKYVTLEVEAGLRGAWYMRQAAEAARAAGLRLRTAHAAPPGLLRWTRDLPPTLSTQGGQVGVVSKEQCGHSLLVLHISELRAASMTSTPGTPGTTSTPGTTCVTSASRRALVQLAADRSERAPSCRAILLFTYDINHENHGMTREEFSTTISDLQIELLVGRKLDVVCVESPGELADIILHFSKAVAEEPYKKAKRDIDEKAEFYMRGDNKNCVTVDKHGNGVSRLWEQMLAILPQSSLEVARSVGAEYKTPRALAQCLQSPGGVSRVSELGVSRDTAPGAKCRRLGPEFARKLHTLFTTEDGNTVIE